MRRSVFIKPDPNLTTHKTEKSASVSSLVQVQKDQPTTTSRIVADHFGKSHKSVTRALATLMTQTGDEEFNRSNFAPIDFLDSRGRQQKEWRMSEQGFALVALGFTGPKAVALRLSFIKAFDEATKRIRQLERRQADPAWIEARRDTKIGHHLIGFALQTTRDRLGKQTETHHFQNEAKLIRYAMMGSSKSSLCRENLSREELRVLAAVERLNARLLALGESFQLRKEKCRLLALQEFAELGRRSRPKLGGVAARSDYYAPLGSRA